MQGCEVVRMYETILGRDGFRKGMDLYFKRHDGSAVTCDDFLAAMADANGADLTALSKWCGPPACLPDWRRRRCQRGATLAQSPAAPTWQR